MKIEELKDKEYGQASKILADYFVERGINYSLKQAKNFLSKGCENHFFAIKDEKIIGTITLTIEGDLGEIKNFVVKKEERRKGYGTKLLEFAIDYARNKKIRNLISLVLPEYKEFFEKYGFENEGLLKDHFRDREDLILMSRKIKKEKQIDLKSELEKIEVSKKTEEQLLRLPLR